MPTPTVESPEPADLTRCRGRVDYLASDTHTAPRRKDPMDIPIKQMTPQMRRLLNTLRVDPDKSRTVSELAAEAGLEDGYVRRILRILRDQEWVTTVKRPGDQRTWWYHLTSQGQVYIRLTLEMGDRPWPAKKRTTTGLDHRAVVAEYQRGDTPMEIGKRHGVHHTTIRNFLKGRGHALRTHQEALELKRRQRGDLEGLARELRMTQQQVRELFQRHGFPLPS